MKRFYGIGILLVLILLFFLPDILKPNSVYAPVDMVSIDKPWSEYNTSMPHNLLQGDGALMFVPFMYYYHSRMRSGHFPFWNPYIYGGAPFFANDQSGVLSPYNLVSLLFSFQKSFLLIAVLKLLVAGIGAYLLLDLFGLDAAACLLGSVAWTFSAYMIMYAHLLTSTAAGSFIPWMFYFFERMIRSMNKRSRLHYVNMFGIAAAIGLSFLAGHAETTAVSVIGLVLYAVVRLVLSGKHIIRGIFYVFTGILLGTLIAAVQLFPFIPILLNSEPLLYRTLYSGTSVHPSLYSMIMMWLVPYMNANASYSYFWDHYLNRGVFVYAYIGMAPLLLSVYAVVHMRKYGKTMVPFLVIAITMLCLTLNIPPFSWLLRLPLLAAAGRWYYLLTDFSLAILAGFGVQYILNTDSVNEKKQWLPIIVTAGISILSIILYLFLTKIHTEWFALFPAGTRDLSPIPLSHLSPDVTIFFIGQFGIAFVFITATAFLFINRRKNPRIISGCLIALSITDLFAFGINYNPDPSFNNFRSTTPLIQKLQTLNTSDYTFYAGDDIILPNLNINYRIRDFRGYDITASLTYQKFLYLMFPGKVPLLGNNGTDPRSRPDIPPDHIIESIAGIRYLVFTASTSMDPTSYKLLGTYKGLSLWENPDAKPLIYLAGGIQPAANDDDALHRLSTDGSELLHTAVVTGITEQEDFSKSKIALTKVKDISGEHVMRVDAAGSGFLVINEPYYPGWHAYIDGEKVPMYHVNYLFQGIKLPPGNYTVMIKYVPSQFSTGAAVSGFMVLFMLVMIVFGALHRKKQFLKEL